MSKELEAKIAQLEKDLTDVKASVKSQISDAVADLKESILPTQYPHSLRYFLLP